MRKVQFFRVWQSYSTLNQLYAETTKGKLRYAAKKNVRKMSDPYEDIQEWLKADALDHDWELPQIPFEDKEFVERFEKYLLESEFEMEPHYFPEDLMQYADGITGQQEQMIAWLFEENKPEPTKKEEPKEDES